MEKKKLNKQKDIGKLNIPKEKGKKPELNKKLKKNKLKIVMLYFQPIIKILKKPIRISKNITNPKT